MTIVIGALDKDKNIIFGGDRCLTHGRKDKLLTPKIFKKKKMLFGVAGRALMFQILKYKFELPAHPKDMTTETYMNTLFIDKLRKVFEKNKMTEIEKNQEDTQSSIVIGYRGELYEIACDFTILQFESDFIAIGSGSSYATGVLELWKKLKKDITTNGIIKAIQVAAKYNLYCDDNIDILKLSK